jgi:hypothetical protein
MFNLPIGTILCSSNLNPEDNVTPGIINHMAIIVDEEQNMVEAQSDEGVIFTSFATYRARPYNWGTWGVLYPRSLEMGKKAAEQAKTYIGKNYGALSSIRRRKRKMNCVSVVSQAYSAAVGTELKMAVPDDIMKYVNLFTDKIEEVT